jgi:transmembrane sensor
MTENQIKSLLQDYADDNISQVDFQRLVNYFRLAGNDEQILAAMDEIWRNLDEKEVLHSDEAKSDIYERLAQKTASTKTLNIRNLKPWYRYAAAAVLLLVGVTTVYLIKHSSNSTIAKRYKNDVKPGFEQATLTLANGDVVNLGKSNSQPAIQEHGVSIKKAADGILLYSYKSTDGSSNADTTENIIRTPKGGQFQVVLSDGSHVWLNTNSSLIFPVKFNSGHRTVKLTGEAYFEVAKNAKSPFAVITANQQVKVLGTHFNINAYTDEPETRTTLLEGKVNVVTPSKSVIIKPGEQAVLAKNNLQVKPADMEEIMAWKNGLFFYNQQSLEVIMRQVSRWYNVDVVFEDENIKGQLFSGALSRFKNISEILEVLETTGSVHFKIEGRRVTVMQ